MSKFLKKQLKQRGKETGTSGTHDDVDDESIVSQTSMARRLSLGAKTKLRRVFKKKGTKKTDEAPPLPTQLSVKKEPEPKENPTNLLPAMSADSAGSDLLPPVEPEKLENIEEEPPVEAVDKSIEVYDDDNDHQKEAQICGGCIIL